MNWLAATIKAKMIGGLSYRARVMPVVGIERKVIVCRNRESTAGYDVCGVGNEWEEALEDAKLNHALTRRGEDYEDGAT